MGVIVSLVKLWTVEQIQQIVNRFPPEEETIHTAAEYGRLDLIRFFHKFNSSRPRLWIVPAPGDTSTSSSTFTRIVSTSSLQTPRIWHHRVAASYWWSTCMNTAQEPRRLPWTLLRCERRFPRYRLMLSHTSCSRLHDQGHGSSCCSRALEASVVPPLPVPTVHRA